MTLARLPPVVLHMGALGAMFGPTMASERGVEVSLSELDLACGSSPRGLILSDVLAVAQRYGPRSSGGVHVGAGDVDALNLLSLPALRQGLPLH